MNKIIHYCWFGDKKPDRLAQKCMKSWKKYLPDYKIMLWNEENFDVNSTPFSKTAYSEKKWAFVSDVARIYALREYGGIYFDTDMMITKDVSDIINVNFFAGWETNHNVAVGVLGVKEKNHPIIEQLYSFYSNTEFDKDNPYSQTIPTLLTKALKQRYGLKHEHLKNQYLDEGVVIYANDYFYPITPDNSSNKFTYNTCMVHYYNGSWLTKAQRRTNKVYSVLGNRLATMYYDWKSSLKSFIKNSARLIAYPIFNYRCKKWEKEKCKLVFEKFMSGFPRGSECDYIVFYNSNWLGTSIATKAMFDNVCDLDELEYDSVIEKIAEKIVEEKYKLIVFSAFAMGWEKLVEVIRQKGYNGKIKVIWHGSSCMNIEEYDWDRFSGIVERVRNGHIDSICFVKKSLYEFYKEKGYNVEFLMNTLSVSSDYIDKTKENNTDNKTRLGLYASGDRWVKNFYNQLCAASMVKNAVVECTPLSSKTIDFSNMIGLEVTGSLKPVKRDELLKMMSKNDLNLYVTFTECAPLVPLESFELGVPCITGNNHHYWENHELGKHVVVNETDNIMKIYEKVEYCLKNKEYLLDLYKDWKTQYDIEARKCLESFLDN